MAGLIALPIAEGLGSIGISSGIATAAGGAAEGYAYSQAEEYAKRAIAKGAEYGWNYVYGQGSFDKLPGEIEEGQNLMIREAKDALNVILGTDRLNEKKRYSEVHTGLGKFGMSNQFFGYDQGGFNGLNKFRTSTTRQDLDPEQIRRQNAIEKQNRTNEIALRNTGGLGYYQTPQMENVNFNQIDKVNPNEGLITIPTNNFPQQFISDLNQLNEGSINQDSSQIGLSDTDPEYQAIAKVYNGSGLTPQSVFIDQDGNFAAYDETGTKITYTGASAPKGVSTLGGIALGFTKGWDTWAGPNSFNNEFPTTLLGTYAFFHDVSYQNGYFDKMGDLQFISRITQNLDKMGFQEKLIAEYTLKWFKNFGYLLGKFVGSKIDKKPRNQFNPYVTDKPIFTNQNLINAKTLKPQPYGLTNEILFRTEEPTLPTKELGLPTNEYRQIMTNYSNGLQNIITQSDNVLNSIIVLDLYD